MWNFIMSYITHLRALHVLVEPRLTDAHRSLIGAKMEEFDAIYRQNSRYVTRPEHSSDKGGVAKDRPWVGLVGFEWTEEKHAELRVDDIRSYLWASWMDINDFYDRTSTTTREGQGKAAVREIGLQEAALPQRAYEEHPILEMTIPLLASLCLSSNEADPELLANAASIYLFYIDRHFTADLAPLMHLGFVQDFRRDIAHFMRSMMYPRTLPTSDKDPEAPYGRRLRGPSNPNKDCLYFCFWDTFSLARHLQTEPIAGYDNLSDKEPETVIQRWQLRNIKQDLLTSTVKGLEAVQRMPAAYQSVEYVKDGEGRIVMRGTPGTLDPEFQQLLVQLHKVSPACFRLRLQPHRRGGAASAGVGGPPRTRRDIVSDVWTRDGALGRSSARNPARARGIPPSRRCPPRAAHVHGKTD